MKVGKIGNINVIEIPDWKDNMVMVSESSDMINILPLGCNKQYRFHKTFDPFKRYKWTEFDDYILLENN